MYDLAEAGGLGIVPGTTGNVDPLSAYPIAGGFGTAIGTGTGQHGFSPNTAGGGTVPDAITGVWSWINKPFRSPMAPTDIVVLVGVVLIAVIMWNFILYHIRIAAEAI
jgi:hypothetical protein